MRHAAWWSRARTGRKGLVSGQQWYERLPEGAQRRVAGDLLYTALRSGDAAWSDLSKAYEDNVFGVMLRQASVRELVGAPRYSLLMAQSVALPANGVSARGGGDGGCTSPNKSTRGA